MEECAYCRDNSNLHTDRAELLDAADAKEGWSLKLWIYKARLFAHAIVDHGYAEVSDFVDIAYCPMCGRKIKEEEERA